MAKVVFRMNGKAVFTRDYTHVSALGFRQKKIKQGTDGIITRVYSGILDATHVDIKLKDGTALREVPVRYFAP